MSFEYSFTRDEFLKSHAKYTRKFTALQLFMGILSACFIVAIFVIVLVKKYAFNDPLDDELTYAKVSALLYFCIFICMLFFTLVFAVRYSAKRNSANFFDTYNEDGLLRYRVELTDTELIVSYKQNVAHLSLKGILRVIQIGDCLYVLFNINSIILVRINQDTQPLVDALKSHAPTKKKKS